MKTHLIAGSRGSNLALAQTHWVIDRLKERKPDLEISVEVIKTQGDKIIDVPLAKIGDKGLFVKEVEQALLDGKIDFAVHSMKDLPSDESLGLIICAIPEREDPADVLLSKHGDLSSLPVGAVVGSSSLRRRAQILHIRPDLNVQDIRGNIDTRIQKLDKGEYDAIILAAAGLNRLGWTGEKYRLPFDICLPAAGQGAIAVQCRENDAETIELLHPLDHSDTRVAVSAERSLLKELQGGCQVPIGVLGLVEGEMLRLQAMVSDISGKRLIRASRCVTMKHSFEIGKQLAVELIEAGAEEILEGIRTGSKPTSMGAAG